MVGLIGVLGSGKSTLLNALLGERDLLPTSSDRAATAAVCKIAYNHGPDGYRAQIRFRSRQDFIDELDKLFQNLKTKRDLMADLQVASDPIEQENIEDQLEEIETNTSHTLRLLDLLCGVQEEDLNSTSTEAFLNTYSSKFRFLGETREIMETDRETFRAKTKPYMDSTPEDIEGEEQIVWPLIDHVTIFIKAEVLKYGIELVDLPGLQDVVEARSRVAERFAPCLDITAIVTPAIRAMEEKGVMSFMKRKHRNEMRMNGKLHRDSLCVVISKIEDMEVKDYLCSRPETKRYPNIPGYLDREKVLDNFIRSAQMLLGRSKSVPLNYDDPVALGAAHRMHTAQRELSNLREFLKQVAVSIRNDVLSERIQKDFRERQMATPGRSSNDGQFHTDALGVFPTSARAYHGIRYPGSIQEIGFPTERHTGIPQFKQWLLKVTFRKREEHLDAVLNQLSGLFIRIQTFITMGELVPAAPMSALQYLGSVHRTHRLVRAHPPPCETYVSNLTQSLATMLRQYGERLSHLDPMKTRTAAVAHCRREYPRQVGRWRFKFPDKTESLARLHEGTQRAILRKNGEYHQSKGEDPYEYQWVDDL
jgi:hypothetical protein